MIDEVSNGLFPLDLTFVMAKFYCFFFFFFFRIQSIFNTYTERGENIF